MDAFRKVDVRMTSYKLGDRANVEAGSNYPVTARILLKSLGLIEGLKAESSDACFQKGFWDLFGGITDTDKNNLAKLLGRYGLGRGGDRNERFYSFQDFQLEGFKAYVEGLTGEEKKIIKQGA